MKVWSLVDTYNEQVEVDLLWVVKIDGLIDDLDLSEDLLFVLFLNERASSAPSLAHIASNRLVEVDKTDQGSADVRLLQLGANIFGNCAHATWGASTDLQMKESWKMASYDVFWSRMANATSSQF